MTKVPATMTPEDYFRYICTDDLAKEMFERYAKFVEGNVEEVGRLYEQIDDLEEEVRVLESEVEELECDVRVLERKLKKNNT